MVRRFFLAWKRVFLEAVSVIASMPAISAVPESFDFVEQENIALMGGKGVSSARRGPYAARDENRARGAPYGEAVRPRLHSRGPFRRRRLAAQIVAGVDQDPET